MAKYVYETYIITTGALLMMPQGHAEKFKIDNHEFTKSKRQPEHGYRYIVRFAIEADGWSSIVTAFNERMIRLEDSLAFYYSMPFIWEWWLFTIKKENDSDNRILVSLYKEKPGVAMKSYHEMPAKQIMGLASLIQSDPKFADTLYYYNSLCRLDTLEYSRAHLPIMFQLIDSVAEEETAKGCKHCGRADYTRTSRKDVEAMLGKQLYKDLYLNLEEGEQTARNATMHGRSNANSLSKITVGHVEEVLKKVRKRLIEKYKLDIPDASKRVDVARYFFGREGTRLGVERISGATIDDYYATFIDRGLHGFNMKQIQDW